ncbi:UNVERIFIED_CONTAM: hypothetical protein GTU68_025948 [Idotea baltica]|nr:hypothetical protein [Idotea baltica]
MKRTRRKFLQSSLFALPVLSAPQIIQPSTVEGAVVLSTWDSGTIANSAAWSVLSAGGRALDAVEQGGIAIENDVNCCVGLGGNPDRDGFVTLDACIMDELANCGSVAFLERIKHPVSVARKVMEETPHVMLVGEGAQRFALAHGFKLESGELSEGAEKAYANWLKKENYRPVINVFNHDTMGTIALDLHGNLSGMCTTSGLGFKMRGRVGDSPIIGAGLFVSNEFGAAVATGQGEEVIRVSGCHLVVEFMRNGATPQEACQRAVERIVQRDPERAKEFQVAFIAIGKDGTYGAFAVQKGFNFTVSNASLQNQVIDADSLL